MSSTNWVSPNQSVTFWTAKKYSCFLRFSYVEASTCRSLEESDEGGVVLRPGHRYRCQEFWGSQF